MAPARLGVLLAALCTCAVLRQAGAAPAAAGSASGSVQEGSGPSAEGSGSGSAEAGSSAVAERRTGSSRARGAAQLLVKMLAPLAGDDLSGRQTRRRNRRNKMVDKELVLSQLAENLLKFLTDQNIGVGDTESNEDASSDPESDSNDSVIDISESEPKSEDELDSASLAEGKTKKGKGNLDSELDNDSQSNSESSSASNTDNGSDDDSGDTSSSNSEYESHLRSDESVVDSRRNPKSENPSKSKSKSKTSNSDNSDSIQDLLEEDTTIINLRVENDKSASGEQKYSRRSIVQNVKVDDNSVAVESGDEAAHVLFSKDEAAGSGDDPDGSGGDIDVSDSDLIVTREVLDLEDDLSDTDENLNGVNKTLGDSGDNSDDSRSKDTVDNNNKTTEALDKEAKVNAVYEESKESDRKECWSKTVSDILDSSLEDEKSFRKYRLSFYFSK